MAYDEPLATRARAGFQRRRVGFEEKRMMSGWCFPVSGQTCVRVKERRMVRIEAALGFNPEAKSVRKRP